MTRSVLTVAFVFLSAAALANPPEIEPAEYPPFPSEPHAPYAGTGESGIKGQAFLRQRGGGVVNCAGSPVLVYPATEYFRTNLYPSAMALMLPPDNPAHGLVRSGVCDMQGNFAVRGLPPGRYYVLTAVRWEVMREPQGGVLRREVDVGPKAEVELVLTDADHAGG